MNIYLIRHTTPDIELIYCYGQSDIDVKDTFPKEVQRIKNILPDFESVKIYASPLQRCHKLARALELGDVVTDDRLKELHFGQWEMKKWNEIDRAKFDYWVDDFVNRRAKEGESYLDLYNRMVSFLQDIVKEKHENVIIVSHGGALRTLLAHIMESPLENLFRVNIDFGGICRLISEKGKLKIDFINR